MCRPCRCRSSWHEPPHTRDMVADPTISSPESSFFTLGLIFLLILVCFALSCLLLGSMSMRGLIIAAARKTNLYNSCNLTQQESHLIARNFFILFAFHCLFPQAGLPKISNLICHGGVMLSGWGSFLK